MKYRSVFDIIGPIMVGPSSSHTAGAVRIGLFTRYIFGHQPEKIKITLKLHTLINSKPQNTASF